ncbi:MAG: hypothetical protein MUC87_13120 [Bacteroidia bacterium]|jgi:hypothetical protein|nr:hypothetical protein [Bacteroidia bacterium]
MIRKITFYPALIFLVLLTVPLLPGCKLFDRTEEIPSYLRISSVNFTALSGEGSSSHQITDVWVFMDNELIGAFEIPCTIPILAEGSHQFLIRAGIKMNGTTTTRAIYPAYKGWESSLTLTRAQVVSAAPSFQYFSGTDFVWLEDFDQPGQTYNDSGAIVQDVFHLTNNPADVFEGARSGYAKLDNDSFDLFIRSQFFTGLHPAASFVYMELNYRCDQPFSVGVMTRQYEYRNVVTVSPRSTWGKIYINLTDAVNQAPSSTGYAFYITQRKPDDVTESYLYLDNIKVLR